jgi:hypothetical protein
MNTSTKKQYQAVMQSYEFGAFVEALKVIFKSDAELSNWVYYGGANLPEYINAIGDADSVNNISETISKLLKGNGLSKVNDVIKKDKKAYKFVVSWLTSHDLPESVKQSFAKMKSSKRNIYSIFICMLISFTAQKENITQSEVVEAQEEA